jgi:hypothetical protein
MRLICVSKMRRDPPPARSTLAASRRSGLGLALGLADPARNAWSSASGLSFSSWLRSAIQPSPMASVMTWASGGLASSRKRRCVTPLVLLLNRSGKHAAKSGTTVFFSSSE